MNLEEKLKLLEVTGFDTKLEGSTLFIWRKEIVSKNNAIEIHNDDINNFNVVDVIATLFYRFENLVIDENKEYWNLLALKLTKLKITFDNLFDSL